MCSPPPSLQTSSSPQRISNLGSPLARPFGILGLWPFRKSYSPPSPLSSLARPIKSSPAHTPAPVRLLPHLPPADGCVLVHPQEAGVPVAREESAPSNPALNTSTLCKDPFGLCLSPGFYPAISGPIAIAHHYITMNVPRVPPALPSSSLGM